MIHYKPWNNNWSPTLTWLHEHGPPTDHHDMTYTHITGSCMSFYGNKYVWRQHGILISRNWYQHFDMYVWTKEWIGTCKNCLGFWCEEHIKKVKKKLKCEYFVLLRQETLSRRKSITMAMFMLNTYKNFDAELFL